MRRSNSWLLVVALVMTASFAAGTFYSQQLSVHADSNEKHFTCGSMLLMRQAREKLAKKAFQH